MNYRRGMDVDKLEALRGQHLQKDIAWSTRPTRFLERDWVPPGTPFGKRHILSLLPGDPQLTLTHSRLGKILVK